MTAPARTATKADTHFVWSKSKAEQAELEAIGWRVAEQRLSHHHAHSTLMQWAGRGEPKLPGNPAVKP